MNICNFDHENVAQGRSVRFSQWFHLVANIKMYKCPITEFELALTISEILVFEIFEVEKVGQGHGVILS